MACGGTRALRDRHVRIAEPEPHVAEDALTRRAATLLALHGLVVLLLGLLCGIPYGSAIVGGFGDEAVRAWNLAHLEGLENGILVLALAGASGFLELRSGEERVVLWSAVLAAYGNVVGAIVGALSGQRGLAPHGPLANWLVFVAFMFGMWGVLVAVPLAAKGAWTHLRSTRG
jgi:hypothetical protein